jgi:hypothetical protein
MLAAQNLWAMDYDKLGLCFRSTNWGSRLEPSVQGAPTARFYDHMQTRALSDTHYEPNLLVVPVVTDNYTEIHLIQNFTSSSWGGLRRVNHGPRTLRVNNLQLAANCESNQSVVEAGNRCVQGRDGSCPMGNLRIGVTSPRAGSELCAQITRDPVALNSGVGAVERPLTAAQAETIARAAVVQRLNFVREQMTAGRLTGVAQNVTYAASGPCREIFTGSANAEVVAAADLLLCVASPRHPNCIRGDVVPDAATGGVPAGVKTQD